MADQCVGVGTGGEKKTKKTNPLGHQSFPQHWKRRFWAELGATKNKPKTRQAGKGKPHNCLMSLLDTGNAESKLSLMESIHPSVWDALQNTASPREEHPCLLSPAANPLRCRVAPAAPGDNTVSRGNTRRPNSSSAQERVSSITELIPCPDFI